MFGYKFFPQLMTAPLFSAIWAYSRIKILSTLPPQSVTFLMTAPLFSAIWAYSRMKKSISDLKVMFVSIFKSFSVTHQ